MTYRQYHVSPSEGGTWTVHCEERTVDDDVIVDGSTRALATCANETDAFSLAVLLQLGTNYSVTESNGGMNHV